MVMVMALVVVAILPSCNSGVARRAYRVAPSEMMRDSLGLAGPLDPAATPGTSKELWIISKPPPPREQPDPQRGDIPLLSKIPLIGPAFANIDTQDITDLPQCGTLVALAPIPGSTKQQLIPIPLEHTEVSANIAAYIASVNVKQRFHNQYESKIEAVYIFPLPQNAAITEFLMTIGDRTIRGIIRERQEAQRIYNEARAQGYVASLLTQERPNIFTQKVANIEPGKTIDIDITYFNTLAYNDGGYEFVFGGEYEDQQEAFRELTFAAILALILVYMVMASQFESIRDPFIILFSILPRSFWLLVVISIIFGWTSLVGVVRAEFLRARNLEYVRAAKALGVGNMTIMFRHMLPNAMVATLTMLPFIVTGTISTLAGLDFLGFGLPSTAPSLGELTLQAKQNLQAPWLAFTAFFTFAIMLSLLVFIFEGVRDAFDPRKTFS